MKNPILKPDEFLKKLAARPPEMRFAGSSRSDFMGWKESVRSFLRKTLNMPENADIGHEDIKVLDERPWHGVRRIELEIFNRAFGLAIPATMLLPLKEKRNGAGLLCQHGHGNFGRLPVIGDRSSPELVRELETPRYDFGLNFALNGFSVIAFDLFNFGQRALSRKGGRDACDMLAHFLNLFDINLVSLQVYEIMLAVSVLAMRDEVDSDRIGMCGLSQGGRMTMFVSALDERIKAAVSSGACNTYSDRVSFLSGACGAQIVPGLLKFLDTPDIFASLAPKPLQLQWGSKDTLIIPEYTEKSVEIIRRCYALSGAENSFSLDRFEGGHQFDFDPALQFLTGHLL